MANAATREIERPSAPPAARVAGALLDRLFTPHGAFAYLRWVGLAPTPVATAHPAEAAPVSARTGDLASPNTTVGAVHFASSGLTAVGEGTLLETAEAAGLEPRNRCRRGICGTCTTPKLSGTVVDVRTGERSDAPGPIRICVSVAEGDVALEL